jgi:hypothetical protein
MLDDGRSLMRLWKEGMKKEDGVEKEESEGLEEGVEENEEVKPRRGLKKVSKQMQKWAKEKEEEQRVGESFEVMGEDWIGHMEEKKRDV